MGIQVQQGISTTTLLVQWITSDQCMNHIRSVCIPQKAVRNSCTQDKLWFNNTASRLVNKKNKAWNTYMRAKRLNKPNKCLLYDRYLKKGRKQAEEFETPRGSLSVGLLIDCIQIPNSFMLTAIPNKKTENLLVMWNGQMDPQHKTLER